MALSFPGLSRHSPPPLLGIDISSSSIKVVELAPGNDVGSLRLQRYAIVALDAAAIVDGNIDSTEQVSAVLSRALRRLGGRAREVALAMPSSAVIAKRITLPSGLREEDYELQVESEASQYIPFPIDEVNLDFQVLGPAPNADDEVEVLLAASRKEQVEDRVAVAEMCGLHPVVMDIDAYAARLAVERVVSLWPDGGKGQVVATFDIGSAVTRASITLDGELIFERDHAFGGAQLTQDLARVFGLSPEDAEMAKRSGELPANYGTDVLRPFIEQGAMDITRALQFFFTSTPYTRVDRILLAGGSCVLPGLAEAVTDRTEVRADILDPFAGMDIADGIREKQLRIDAPALLTACGLAMRRFEP